MVHCTLDVEPPKYGAPLGGRGGGFRGPGGLMGRGGPGGFIGRGGPVGPPGRGGPMMQSASFSSNGKRRIIVELLLLKKYKNNLSKVITLMTSKSYTGSLDE